MDKYFWGDSLVEYFAVDEDGIGCEVPRQKEKGPVNYSTEWTGGAIILRPKSYLYAQAHR